MAITPDKMSKVCEECGKNCQPIPIASAPASSEFYCKTCHKSYPMDLDAAKYMLQVEAQNRGR